MESCWQTVRREWYSYTPNYNKGGRARRNASGYSLYEATVVEVDVFESHSEERERLSNWMRNVSVHRAHLDELVITILHGCAMQLSTAHSPF